MDKIDVLIDDIRATLLATEVDSDKVSEAFATLSEYLDTTGSELSNDQMDRMEKIQEQFRSAPLNLKNDSAH
jgi:hypothetical protein